MSEGQKHASFEKLKSFFRRDKKDKEKAPDESEKDEAVAKVEVHESVIREPVEKEKAPEASAPEVKPEEAEAAASNEVPKEVAEQVPREFVEELENNPEVVDKAVEEAMVGKTEAEKTAAKEKVKQALKDDKTKAGLASEMLGWVKDKWRGGAAGFVAGASARFLVKASIRAYMGGSFGVGIVAGAIAGGLVEGGRKLIHERNKYDIEDILKQFNAAENNPIQRAAIISEFEKQQKDARLSGDPEKIKQASEILHQARAQFEANLEKKDYENKSEKDKLLFILKKSRAVKKEISKEDRKAVEEILSKLEFKGKKTEWSDIDKKAVFKAAGKGIFVGALGGAIGGFLSHYFIEGFGGGTGAGAAEHADASKLSNADLLKQFNTMGTGGVGSESGQTALAELAKQAKPNIVELQSGDNPWNLIKAHLATKGLKLNNQELNTLVRAICDKNGISIKGQSGTKGIEYVIGDRKLPVGFKLDIGLSDLYGDAHLPTGAGATEAVPALVKTGVPAVDLTVASHGDAFGSGTETLASKEAMSTSTKTIIGLSAIGAVIGAAGLGHWFKKRREKANAGVGGAKNIDVNINLEQNNNGVEQANNPENIEGEFSLEKRSEMFKDLQAKAEAKGIKTILPNIFFESPLAKISAESFKAIHDHVGQLIENKPESFAGLNTLFIGENDAVSPDGSRVLVNAKHSPEDFVAILNANLENAFKKRGEHGLIPNAESAAPAEAEVVESESKSPELRKTAMQRMKKFLQDKHLGGIALIEGQAFKKLPDEKFQEVLGVFAEEIANNPEKFNKVNQIIFEVRNRTRKNNKDGNILELDVTHGPDVLRTYLRSLEAKDVENSGSPVENNPDKPAVSKEAEPEAETEKVEEPKEEKKVNEPVVAATTTKKSKKEPEKNVGDAGIPSKFGDKNVVRLRKKAPEVTTEPEIITKPEETAEAKPETRVFEEVENAKKEARELIKDADNLFGNLKVGQGKKFGLLKKQAEKHNIEVVGLEDELGLILDEGMQNYKFEGEAPNDKLRLEPKLYWLLRLDRAIEDQKENLTLDIDSEQGAKELVKLFDKFKEILAGAKEYWESQRKPKKTEKETSSTGGSPEAVALEPEAQEVSSETAKAEKREYSAEFLDDYKNTRKEYTKIRNGLKENYKIEVLDNKLHGLMRSQKWPGDERLSLYKKLTEFYSWLKDQIDSDSSGSFKQRLKGKKIEVFDLSGEPKKFIVSGKSIKADYSLGLDGLKDFVEDYVTAEETPSAKTKASPEVKTEPKPPEVDKEFILNEPLYLSNGMAPGTLEVGPKDDRRSVLELRQDPSTKELLLFPKQTRLAEAQEFYSHFRLHYDVENAEGPHSGEIEVVRPAKARKTIDGFEIAEKGLMRIKE